MKGLDSGRSFLRKRNQVRTLLFAFALAVGPLITAPATTLATPITASAPSASPKIAAVNPPLNSHNVAYIFDDSIFPCGGAGCGMNDTGFPAASIFRNALTGSAPGAGNTGTYTTSSGTTTVNLTNVPLSTLITNSNALSGFDTAIVYETCGLGANASALSNLNSFLEAGNKVLILDADGCASSALGQADWGNFVFPFATNSPGPQGASGSYTKIEASPLTAGLNLGPQPGDAVGDANIFTTFSGAWFQAIAATNVNGATGIVEAYGRTAPPSGGGLAIYEGEDFWFTFGPSPHLRLVFDNMLGQTWNPDALPSTSAASHITLSPLSQSVPVGAGATVTAVVTDSAGTPQSGVAVNFQVTSGPDTGKSGSGTTGSSGQASFILVGNASGIDVIQASFTDSSGHVHSSNTSQLVFTAPPSPIPSKEDRYFFFPDVKVVSYISAVDAPQCARDLVTQLGVSRDSALIACGVLAASANPTPPPAFTTDAWSSFVQSKEYRGYVHLPAMVVHCTDNTVVGLNNQPLSVSAAPSPFAVEGFEWSAGYTPGPRGLAIQFYSDAEPFLNDATGSTVAALFDHDRPSVSLHADGTLVVSFLAASRIATEDRLAAAALLNYDAPFIWTVVQERFNCHGGQESVSVANSEFPTTNLYIDGTLTSWYTENHLVDFIADGGNTALNPPGTGYLALTPTCGSSVGWSLHGNQLRGKSPGGGCLGLILGGPNGGVSGDYL